MARIAVWYHFPHGGALRALGDHIDGLMKRGHELIAFHPPLGKDTSDWIRCEQVEVPLAGHRVGRGYVTNVINHLLRPGLAERSMAMHAMRCAAMIAERGKFDLLFANTCRSYHSPHIGKFVRGIPKLLYLQEPNRPLYEALPVLPWVRLPGSGSWRAKLRKRFDIRMAGVQAATEIENSRSYDKILVNSYFSRESVARAYGTLPEVCYLGIDTGKFVGAPQPPSGPSFVLGVGNLDAIKRADWLVRAVARLPEPRPKVVWTANMKNPAYVQEVESLASTLGVKWERIDMASDAELVRLYQTAACVIYPPRLEPFGYVPLEATACGAPVIGIQEGGIRETLGSGIGYLAEPSPEGIARKLSWVLANQAEARQIASQNRAVIESQWGLDAAIDRLESHLLRLIERR